MKKIGLFSIIVVTIIVAVLFSVIIRDSKTEEKKKDSGDKADSFLSLEENKKGRENGFVVYSDGVYDYYYNDADILMMVVLSAGVENALKLENDQQLEYVKEYIGQRYSNVDDDNWNIESGEGGTIISYNYSANGEIYDLANFSFTSDGKLIGANIELAAVAELTSDKKMVEDNRAIELAKEYLKKEVEEKGDKFANYNSEVKVNEIAGKIYLDIVFLPKNEKGTGGYLCEIDAYSGELYRIDLMK